MIQESAIQGTLLALASAWLLVWLLRPVALSWGLLDHPGSSRKRHAAPTPVTGGLAMTAATIIGGVLLWDGSREMAALLAGMLMLLAVGVLDDLRDLRWPWRIMVQVVAALTLYYGGGVRVEQLGGVFGLPELTLGPLSLPLTVIATVGLINAINLIDGVDGLAGMLVLAALVMLTAAALYAGNSRLAGESLVLAGAVLGFLVWNLRVPGRSHAMAFMGNSGSALLGLAVAWFCFRLTQNPGHPVSPVLALWLLPVPVMDCLVLVARRCRQRRSPFSAGRDHIHHCMQDAGFDPLGTCVVLAVISLIGGLIAGQAMRMDFPNVVILAAFVAACIGWYVLSSEWKRAVLAFAVLRCLLLGNVAAARVILVPPASNDELHEQQKIRAQDG